jgi:hypothetical protein
VRALLSRCHSPGLLNHEHQKGDQNIWQIDLSMREASQKTSYFMSWNNCVPKTISTSEDHVSARHSPQFTTLGKAASTTKAKPLSRCVHPPRSTHTYICIRKQSTSTPSPYPHQAPKTQTSRFAARSLQGTCFTSLVFKKKTTASVQGETDKTRPTVSGEPP